MRLTGCLLKVFAEFAPFTALPSERARETVCSTHAARDLRRGSIRVFVSQEGRAHGGR